MVGSSQTRAMFKNTTFASRLLLSAEKVRVRGTLRWWCREIFCLRSFALCVHKVDEKCVSLSLFVLQSNELLNGNCSPPETLALARSRQKQRILRPLVLETLFRASNFRSRGVRNTERKRCISSGEEALSPLRLSI